MLAETAVVLLTLAAAMITAAAQYLFKRAIPKFGLSVREIVMLLKNRSILLGLFAYVVSLFLYLIALGSGQLSFVYPLFSSTFIFVMLISHFAFNERISARRMVGVLLILAGISMIALTY